MPVKLTVDAPESICLAYPLPIQLQNTLAAIPYGTSGDSATFSASIEFLEESFCCFICRPADCSSRSMEKHSRNPSPHEALVAVFLHYCFNHVPNRTSLKSITSAYTL